MASSYPGSVDTYVAKVDNVDDVMASHVNDLQNSVVAEQTHGRKMALLVVKNTSGGAVTANQVGYVDAAGEFKTTATAYLSDVQWAVVIAGAANNADVVVALRGLVTVELTANCSIGDFLYTSTTAGRALPVSTPHYAMFAIAKTANTGGAGGTCEAVLHTGTSFFPHNAGVAIYIATHDTLDFVSTINGAPVGATLVYGAVTSGNENCIANTGTLAHLVLRNTTRGEDALIQSVVLATNTITLTAAVPGTWINGDALTVVDATWGGNWFGVSVEGEVPATTRGVSYNGEQLDTGAANETMRLGEVSNSPNSEIFRTQVANIYVQYPYDIGLENYRFVLYSDASGGATKSTILRQRGLWLAVP